MADEIVRGSAEIALLRNGHKMLVADFADPAVAEFVELQVDVVTDEFRKGDVVAAGSLQSSRTRAAVDHSRTGVTEPIFCSRREQFVHIGGEQSRVRLPYEHDTLVALCG